MKFDIDNINKLLEGYSDECEMLLLNVFELVLTNALGLVICEKDPRELNISEMDREIIKNKLEKLNEEDLYKELLKYMHKCFDELLIKDTGIKDYSKEVLKNISMNIKNSISLDKLENLFISFEESKKTYIEYVDGAKISNEDFRKLSNEILTCDKVYEKIKLLRENIRSIEDLIDILNAECLFGEEYTLYFESLNEEIIVLLYKYISDMDFDNNYQFEWHKKFSDFIKKLEKCKFERINRLKSLIKVIY